MASLINMLSIELHVPLHFWCSAKKVNLDVAKVGKFSSFLHQVMKENDGSLCCCSGPVNESFFS